MYFSEHQAYFPALVMTHLFAHYLMKILWKLWKWQNLQIQKIASTVTKKFKYTDPIFCKVEGINFTKASTIAIMELFDILPIFRSPQVKLSVIISKNCTSTSCFKSSWAA